jgi:hypothetical protein
MYFVDIDFHNNGTFDIDFHNNGTLQNCKEK